MAYNYPLIIRNNDGTYGPTGNGLYYLPASYHNPTAKKRANKTRWCLKPPQQYEVFRVANINYVKNHGDGGLYGFLDNMDEILGKDNEERIAFFPDTEASPWHGYPISSSEISEEIIKSWKNSPNISTRNYRSLLKREI